MFQELEQEFENEKVKFLHRFKKDIVTIFNTKIGADDKDTKMINLLNKISEEQKKKRPNKTQLERDMSMFLRYFN